MPLVRITGAPGVVNDFKVDGRKDGQTWHLVNKLRLAEQTAAVKKLLGLPEWTKGLPGLDLYAANAKQRGLAIPLSLTYDEAKARNGGRLAEVWLERRDLTPEEIEEEQQGAAAAAPEPAPADEPRAASPAAAPAGEPSAAAAPAAAAPAAPPPPPPPPPPGAAAPAAAPPPAAPAPSPRRPQQRPPPPAGSRELYEAGQLGWLPLRRCAQDQNVVEIPLPLGDAAQQLSVAAVAARAAGRPEPPRAPCTQLCYRCSHAVLRQDPARVLWADVGEHAIPVVPNTSYKEGWVAGKLKYTRNNKAMLWEKALGAGWKERFFRITPNGLHYYAGDVMYGKDQWKARNSKVFKPDTRLIEDPAEELYKDIKEKHRWHYFALQFFDPDEVLVLRQRTAQEKAEWCGFLKETLKQLKQDWGWAARSHPVEMKALCSNRIARIADLRQAALDAHASADEDRRLAREAAQAAATARAAHEHILRAMDRHEGTVAAMMERVRELRRSGEEELRAAMREREKALREVGDAQEAKKAAAARQADVILAQEESDERCAELQEQIEAARAARDAAAAERQRIFAKWRKTEERGSAHAERLAHAAGPALAFSPPDSPYRLRGGRVPPRSSARVQDLAL